MIYVDELREVPATRKGAKFPTYQSCHMIAHGNTAEANSRELREFARKIGLQEQWIQHSNGMIEHFDLTPRKRREAIALGAQRISSRELLVMVKGVA